MTFEQDFIGDTIEDIICISTKNHIKAQIIEYYLLKPDSSFPLMGKLFRFSGSVISTIISSYFQYPGTHYEILVLQSKI